MAQVPRLKERYEKEIVPQLMREFGYKCPMRVPRLKEIVIITKARKSIAGFKVRKGMTVGVAVTLRGRRMYYFLDRLVNVALPRVRDFHGVSRYAFDGRGNYALGMKEQVVFPEINYDKIDKIRGLQVTIVTTAQNDEEGRRLLELMGMPFAKA